MHRAVGMFHQLRNVHTRSDGDWASSWSPIRTDTRKRPSRRPFAAIPLGRPARGPDSANASALVQTVSGRLAINRTPLSTSQADVRCSTHARLKASRTRDDGAGPHMSLGGRDERSSRHLWLRSHREFGYELTPVGVSSLVLSCLDRGSLCGPNPGGPGHARARRLARGAKVA
jgi:hypothetical protein